MSAGAVVKNGALAVTPPMGWNSWNCFRCYQLTETVVLGMADALVDSGMRDAGYEYLVIDDCWQAFERTSAGRLTAHPGRFPNGMRALGEQIHDRGLKFGLYLAPGRKTCAMIYDRYPARDIGSFGHEEADVESLVEWGVDYLKYDWCRANRGGTGLDYEGAFERMATTLSAADRPIVLSISEYGASRPWEWAGAYGHLWRTTPDIAPRWRSVMRILDRQHGLADFAGPGGWNDPDMLEVGNAGLGDIEARSHFMLWALLAAPLMAGNDLRTMSSATRELLTHPGVLSVSQDPLGQQGQRVARHGRVEIWERHLVDGTAVGVLNRGRTRTALTVAGGDLSAGGQRVARLPEGSVEVWTGASAEGGEWMLQPHEMRMFRGGGMRHPSPGSRERPASPPT